MTLLSITAYAKTHLVSRQAARRWKSGGYLTIADGMVDVEASDARLRRAMLGRFAATSARAAVSEVAEPRRSSPTDPLDVFGSVAGPAVALIADDDGLNTFVADLLAGRFRSQADAAEVKENALALRHILVARREAGLVVEIAVAERVLFEASRSARDAWLNFPTRIAPLLAADLGVAQDVIVEALTTHVHRQLADLGEPDADFSDKGNYR